MSWKYPTGGKRCKGPSRDRADGQCHNYAARNGLCKTHLLMYPHTCGNCRHGKPARAGKGMIDCHCPLPYFLASEFTGNLRPDDGTGCPAWRI